MEKILQSGWLFVFITTLILIGINIFLNRSSFKFRFNKSDILTSSAMGILFWLVLYVLNTDTDFVKGLFVLVIGILLSLFVQSLGNKKEVLAGLGTFGTLLMVYKLSSQADMVLMGLFITPVLASTTLSLIKNNELINNKLIPIVILLPLYTSLTWFKVLDFGVDEIFTRTVLIFTVVFLALLSSFALDIDINVNQVAKRAGLFVIIALLTYLIINNFLTLPIKIVLLIIGGFLFAYVLNLLNINSDQNTKDTFFNSISGFVLILLAGFIVTRIFGTWGLLLVSLCCIGAIPTGANNIVNLPSITALFFSLRALVQAFIQTNTLNVTGLNLNHPYVYVGLIIGLALPFVILALAAIYGKLFKGFNPFILIVSALVMPLLAAYLIHAEATGSLIIALSVSALILAIAGSIIANKFNFDIIKNYSIAMLPLASLTGIVLINSQKLVDIGNLASRIQRIEVIISIAIILVLIILFWAKTTTKPNRT